MYFCKSQSKCRYKNPNSQNTYLHMWIRTYLYTVRSIGHTLFDGCYDMYWNKYVHMRFYRLQTQ